MPISMCDAEGKVEMRCRAIGSDGEIQSGEPEEMYNVRGLMNNSCDKLSFKVLPSKQ